MGGNVLYVYVCYGCLNCWGCDFLGVLCVQPCVAYGCHYGWFLSCMSEELCWFLELGYFFATGSMPQIVSFCVCYLESGLCIRIECRVWVHFGFEVRCVNACSPLLQRLVVGRVFTVFFWCCILFLGSAIGCWLFAATVYWMFGSVA